MLRPLVGRIIEFEQGLQALPEEALRQKTLEWKAELSAIEDSAELKRRLDAPFPRRPLPW